MGLEAIAIRFEAIASGISTPNPFRPRVLCLHLNLLLAVGGEWRWSPEETRHGIFVMNMNNNNRFFDPKDGQ